MDPIYGFQAVNVEAQQKSQSSLLHFTRNMLQIRRHHPVFGTGAYTEMWSSNPAVLTFTVRRATT
ncbi:hypothetical protein GCM10020219_065550 [Nonomuraea dietziae]